MTGILERFFKFRLTAVQDDRRALLLENFRLPTFANDVYYLNPLSLS